MKRILSLIFVLCLVFSLFGEAMAEPKWEITQQTKCTTTKKTVTISVKVKGKGIKYQWVFTNPDDPEDQVTGKNLAKDKRFKGIKVAGYTKNKIVLSKVPEALHGWTVYCHLYSNAYKMDTDPVAVAVYGLEPPEQPKKPAGEGGDNEDESSAEPKEFRVTANGKYLFEADASGNGKGKEAVSSLTFPDKINVVVKSEDPIKNWTVNGIRFEPEAEINSFSLLNLTSDTAISVKRAAKTAASAKVDDSVTLTVTCKGCSFTYLPKGLKKVSSGEVPSGAVIYVFADSYDSAANGYSINGEEAQNQGAASMQVTITEDTEIVVK